MQVLDLENQWTLLTPFEAHLLEGVKSTVSEGFRGQRRKAFCPLFHPEQLQEIWCRFLRIHGDFLQGKAHLLDDRFRAIRLADATVMTEHVEQGMIRNTAAVGETASFEIRHALVL
jgi:hypothetical protein